jgi:hypothetical protein
MAQDASAGYWSGGGGDFSGRREVMTLCAAGDGRLGVGGYAGDEMWVQASCGCGTKGVQSRLWRAEAQI